MIVTIFRDAEDADHIEVYLGRVHPIEIMEGLYVSPAMLFTLGTWRLIFGHKYIPRLDHPVTADLDIKATLRKLTYVTKLHDQQDKKVKI